MKSRIFCFICLIFVRLLAGNLSAFAQNIIDTSGINLYINIGINYNYIPEDNRYFPPDNKWGVNTNLIAGGYRLSEPAFNFGIDAEKSINNKFIIQSGLFFYNRKFVFESNYDSVIKYVPVTNRDKYQLKGKTCYYNIEIPILLKYRIIDNLYILTGFKFSINNYVYTYSKFFDYTEKWKYQGSSFFHGPQFIYPAIFIEYSIHKRIHILLGFEYGNNLIFGFKLKLK